MLYRYWNHLWTEMSEAGRKTFPWDLARGAALGTTGTIQMTFALVVAIHYFDAGFLQKSLIAGSFSAGLLLSLPYASWSPIIQRKTMRGALPGFLAAFGLVVASLARNAAEYTCGIVFFGTCAALAAPIMTSIYRDNYRGIVRGQVFGITTLVTICIGLATQSAGGQLLDTNLAYYRALFLAIAAMSVVRGVSILQMPCRENDETVTPNPLRSLSAVRENPMFGYVLFAWFLLGFANLALQPQRIEYLSQPEYGLELSPGTIVLIVGVTTEIGRLCVIQAWAHLFDRYNFIWMRIAISTLILAHTLLYYNTHSIGLLVLGSVFLGVAYGGGAISWTLWVTKFAPPDETARYMSVHTFTTGIRGTLGPLVGYLAVKYLTIQITSWIAAVFIVLSIIVLWYIRNLTARTGHAVPQEAPLADDTA